MTCPRCQHENPPRAKFCLECGGRLALTCPACRSELPGGAKFCLECGEPIVALTQAKPRVVSPESYTPKHLAEKILMSKTALEGERKQVTVLFADLKGSMELLADRDPEDARKLLDPLLRHMMEAVHRYEGTVNQVMGDGIMALFGAPLAHEDHAVRACYAALRMQESAKRYAEDMRREQGVTIRIRVGLNSGEVVVRAIGSDLHMDYSAVGQTTHLAARMEQLADPGSILLTPATLMLAEGFIQVNPLGPMAVKGRPAPIEVYALTGASAVRSRLQAAATRGLSRFVGRDAEVEQLHWALEGARGGRGQVVAVVGEPGVGKSRLFYEFTHSHRTRDWLILEASSISYGKATSYLPVIDLLKAYFQIDAHDDARRMREKVTGKLVSLDEALQATLPAFMALLDLPVENAAWQALDPPERRQRTLDSIKRLLLRESQAQPLLVVFEDLHWIDSETQALLDGLIESLPAARLLLLVNYRPEYRHGWGSKTYYRQLRVDALPAESLDDLLASLLGKDASLASIKRTLVERTEGNPFFLEESVRALVETRALTGDPGAYRLAPGAQAIQVPATVQAILAARIDRLAPEEKQLLQTAAVIGKGVTFRLLQAIAELPEDGLRQGLAHLQAAEFLYETHLFPELEYTFKHALTHDVAYGSLLQDRRRALHARIVEVLEADRLSEQVEFLAHHAAKAEAWEKAVRYLRQAGTKALARSANREARTLFEQALAAGRQLPEMPEILAQMIDVAFDLRNALAPLGELDRELEHLQGAEALAERLGDQRRLGWISAYLANYRFWRGDPEGTVAAGHRALTIATAVDDFELRLLANHRLGHGYHALGDYRRAIDVLQQNVDVLRGDLIHQQFGLGSPPAVASRFFLAWSLAEQGQFSEAIARGQEAVEIAEAVAQPISLVMAYLAVGIASFRRGDLQRAIAAFEHSLSLCRTRDVPLFFAWAASALGAAYTAAGRLGEGLPLLEQALDHATQTETLIYQPLRLAWLAEAWLAKDRTGEALAFAARALDLAVAQKEAGHEAWVRRVLGEAASCGDSPEREKAEDHYREALALAADRGMRPLVGHCHLGLGRLYRRTGRPAEVREHLTTAATMYREMGMPFWLEQAEAGLTDLG